MNDIRVSPSTILSRALWTLKEVLGKYPEIFSYFKLSSCVSLIALMTFRNVKITTYMRRRQVLP